MRQSGGISADRAIHVPTPALTKIDVFSHGDAGTTEIPPKSHGANRSTPGRRVCFPQHERPSTPRSSIRRDRARNESPSTCTRESPPISRARGSERRPTVPGARPRRQTVVRASRTPLSVRHNAAAYRGRRRDCPDPHRPRRRGRPARLQSTTDDYRYPRDVVPRSTINRDAPPSSTSRRSNVPAGTISRVQR